MKKQKKQKPKTKRNVAAQPNVAASPSRGAGRSSGQRARADRGNEFRMDRRGSSASGLRKSAGYAGYKGALAAAATYSSDDRQALGLLLLPFLILAFAIGSSQSLRWHPAYDEQITAAAPIPQPVTLVRPASPDVVRAVTETVPTLTAQFNTSTLAPVAAAPLVVVAAAPPAVVAATPPESVSAVVTEADRNPIVAAQVPAAAVPASPGIEIVPSHAAGQIVQSALIPDVVALSPRMAEPSITAKAAAPVSIEPSSMAPGTILPSAAPAQSVAAAKPIELAALPQEIEPPMPGSTVTTVPLAGPSNVCVPEAAQVNKVSPARLAALGGETGGGYVDPIAFGMELAASAREQLDDFTVYTDQYRTIAYPNGDVPSFYGVCTDVIIRAYRGLGVDLQALVHQSKLGSGDTNIDHRRVGTLQKYFATYGESIPISEFAEDYWPGDVISYYRPQNAHSRSHIAIVSDIVGPSGNFMIIHNRGWGPQQEDALFVDQMTGHYRYSAVRRPNLAPAKALMSKSTAAAKSKAAAGTEQKPAQPPSAGARASLAPVKPAPGDAVAR